MTTNGIKKNVKDGAVYVGQIAMFIMLMFYGIFQFCIFAVCICDTNPVPVTEEYYFFITFALIKCLLVSLFVIFIKGNNVFKITISGVIAVVNGFNGVMFLKGIIEDLNKTGVNKLFITCEVLLFVSCVIIFVLCMWKIVKAVKIIKDSTKHQN